MYLVPPSGSRWYSIKQKGDFDLLQVFLPHSLLQDWHCLPKLSLLSRQIWYINCMFCVSLHPWSIHASTSCNTSHTSLSLQTKLSNTRGNLPTISVARMVVRIVPFHSGSIVPALHSGAPCDTCRPVQVNGRRRTTAASEPLRSYFCAFFKGSDSRGFLSLRLFYAWDIVACCLSGAKRDCAMRTLAKSQTCEVYCVSGHGHSGCSPAQVSHHCFHCASKFLCFTQEPFSQINLTIVQNTYFATTNAWLMISFYYTLSSMVHLNNKIRL